MNDQPAAGMAAETTTAAPTAATDGAAAAPSHRRQLGTQRSAASPADPVAPPPSAKVLPSDPDPDPAPSRDHQAQRSARRAARAEA